MLTMPLIEAMSLLTVSALNRFSGCAVGQVPLPAEAD